jgi:uncharacterized protein YkwD
VRSAAILAGLAAALLACAHTALGVYPNPSNGAKLGEALAFASVAAAAQVVQTAAEQQARNNAPVTHAHGVVVSRGCDNDDQYGCVTVTPADGRPPEAEMSDDEVRDYVAGYVSGVRKLNGAPRVRRDEALDAFAQAGSEELAMDHVVGQHMAAHAKELHGAGGEAQGPADGAPPGPLQDRIGEILLRMVGEGAGGTHHDVLLRPEWRKIGVGIARQGGRIYFTVDLST